MRSHADEAMLATGPAAAPTCLDHRPAGHGNACEIEGHASPGLMTFTWSMWLPFRSAECAGRGCAV